MTFREIGHALGEFNVPYEHEKELEKVILENVSFDTIAKELGEDLESLAEALAEVDYTQFGD